MAMSTGMSVSDLIRSKKATDVEDTGDAGEPKKASREDWRKAKELEEARKAGTAPAAVDESGKDINPHIPQYISTVPWYYGSTGPTLKHQRQQEDKIKEVARLDEWYKRGVNLASTATKFRKGSCANCGSMTHQKKDCLERPRKVGAKFTGTNIAPDEFLSGPVSLDYDGKRDRWNGYDPEEHSTILDEYQKVEEAKRELKAETLRTAAETGDQPDDDDDLSEDDEDKYADEIDMPGTKVDSKQRITVRNLRIREDTAKYLRNLDPNSAYYDPKTRSMRDNPYQDTAKNPDEVDYAGENFVRFSGDTQAASSAQLFAWEAHDKGLDVHVLADPTKLEVLQREYEKKKGEYKGKVHNTLIDRYGGAEHLDAPPKTLLLAQTEDYVEYSRHGKVIKGNEKPTIKSRYEEDVLILNHTSVWGSFWYNGQWGYACCHAFVKNSYCVGSVGKVTSAYPPIEMEKDNKNDEGETSGTGRLEEVEGGEEEEEEENEEPQKSLVELHREKKKKKKSKKNKRKKRKEEREEEESGSDEDKDEDKIDPDKLKEALLREELNSMNAESAIANERKRPYNSTFEVKQLTTEEKEAFMMKRKRDFDPMDQLFNKHS